LGVFGHFLAACEADIDPERGAARPLGGSAASARQPRLRKSAAVRCAHVPCDTNHVKFNEEDDLNNNVLYCQMKHF
jgi:hypothetical protein